MKTTDKSKVQPKGETKMRGKKTEIKPEVKTPSQARGQTVAKPEAKRRGRPPKVQVPLAANLAVEPEKKQRGKGKVEPKVETKVCSKCREEKPVSEYYTLASGKLTAYCKPCNKANAELFQMRKRIRTVGFEKFQAQLDREAELLKEKRKLLKLEMKNATV